MTKLREYGRLLVAFALVAMVIVAVVGIVEVLGLRARRQAEVELRRLQRIEAQTELLEQRQMGWLMAPGIVAQLNDTIISAAATGIGWLLALGMIALQFTERRRG